MFGDFVIIKINKKKLNIVLSPEQSVSWIKSVAKTLYESYVGEYVKQIVKNAIKIDLIDTSNVMLKCHSDLVKRAPSWVTCYE